jgi:hypothetical protein
MPLLPGDLAKILLGEFIVQVDTDRPFLRPWFLDPDCRTRNDIIVSTQTVTLPVDKVFDRTKA